MEHLFQKVAIITNSAFSHASNRTKSNNKANPIYSSKQPILIKSTHNQLQKRNDATLNKPTPPPKIDIRNISKKDDFDKKTHLLQTQLEYISNGNNANELACDPSMILKHTIYCVH